MFDFRRYARDKGIEIAEAGQHHHTHQGWIQTHCPLCAGGTRGFHLGFNISKGYFSCWRCGGLSVWKYLKTVESGDIKGILQKYSGKSLNGRRVVRLRKPDCSPPPGLGKLKKFHKEYLTSRGFAWKAVSRTWDLKATGQCSGDWSWRVVAPIRARSGRIVAYLGRSIGEALPKYKMTADEDCAEDPKSFLYGIDKVDSDTVLIVEGVTDAWRFGPGAVAALGVTWKKPQANILRNFKRRFVIFDPDEAGRKKAETLAKWLSFYPGETEIIEGLRCDPGDLSDEEAQEIKAELLK